MSYKRDETVKYDKRMHAQTHALKDGQNSDVMYTRRDKKIIMEL